jgi:hypothetical protein
VESPDDGDDGDVGDVGDDGDLLTFLSLRLCYKPAYTYAKHFLWFRGGSSSAVLVA